MIVESIVTTVGADGRVNCAPMGVEWGEEVIVLKPFLETATYRNVVATRTAVVNLIDDARVFARAAISNPEYPTRPALTVQGVVLADGVRVLARTFGAGLNLADGDPVTISVNGPVRAWASPP